MQQIKDIEKYSDTKPISTFHTTISMPEVNSSEILPKHSFLCPQSCQREAKLCKTFLQGEIYDGFCFWLSAF